MNSRRRSSRPAEDRRQSHASGRQGTGSDSPWIPYFAKEETVPNVDFTRASSSTPWASRRRHPTSRWRAPSAGSPVEGDADGSATRRSAAAAALHRQDSPRLRGRGGALSARATRAPVVTDPAGAGGSASLARVVAHVERLGLGITPVHMEQAPRRASAAEPERACGCEIAVVQVDRVPDRDLRPERSLSDGGRSARGSL